MANYDKDEDFILDISILSKEELSGYEFVDIREPDEVAKEPITDVEVSCKPLSRFKSTASFGFDPFQKYILVCVRGVRSLLATRQCHRDGATNTYSLDGGCKSIHEYFRK